MKPLPSLSISNLVSVLIVQIRFDVAERKTGVIVDRSLIFNIKIKDINDNAPEFPKKEFNITVREDHQRGEYPQDGV